MKNVVAMDPAKLSICTIYKSTAPLWYPWLIAFDFGNAISCILEIPLSINGNQNRPNRDLKFTLNATQKDFCNSCLNVYLAVLGQVSK